MSGLEKVTPELLRGLPLPALPRESDKNARGRILIVGGSEEVPGAVLLAAHAALRAGAGRFRPRAAFPLLPPFLAFRCAIRLSPPRS